MIERGGNQEEKSALVLSALVLMISWCKDARQRAQV
jgi:hypothetical protein